MKIGKQNKIHKWKKNLYIPIGDLLEYDGYIYKCLGSDGGCKYIDDTDIECSFSSSGQCGRVPCSAFKRKDNKYVMFKKIK